MGRMGEKVEITKYKLVDTNMHRDVKNSIGNGVAKEFICMTRGHEQWCGDCWREQGVLGGRGQRRKNWDNCNSIINKIYLKSKINI